MQKQSGEVEEASYPVIGRLKSLYGASSLSELAEGLDTPLATVKGWSQRQSVPLPVLVQAASDRDCSLDWLVGLINDPMSLRRVPPSKGLNHSLGDGRGSKELNQEQGGTAISKVAAIYEPGTNSSSSVLSLRTPDGPMEFHFVPHLNPSPKPTQDPSYRRDDRVLGDIAFQAAWMIRNLGRAGDGFAIVEVIGTSMEPTLYQGATLVIDRTQRAIEAGGLFALRLGENVVVRRLQRLISGAIHVLCDNATFGPELVPAAEELALDIIGRVVWPRSR